MAVQGAHNCGCCTRAGAVLGGKKGACVGGEGGLGRPAARSPAWPSFSDTNTVGRAALPVTVAGKENNGGVAGRTIRAPAMQQHTCDASAAVVRPLHHHAEPQGWHTAPYMRCRVWWRWTHCPRGIAACLPPACAAMPCPGSARCRPPMTTRPARMLITHLRCWPCCAC